MRSVSGVGLGLSLVFVFLLLALMAELYYLLWWKKNRIRKRSTEMGSEIQPRKAFFLMFCCWKNPSSFLISTTQELCSSSILVHEPQTNPRKDLFSIGEENVEDNLSVPQRFLFTIVEETKEDMESEDGTVAMNGKQSSLSDLFHILETPFLTPLTSSPYFTPPLTPSYYSPFFESKSDAVFNKLWNSPPPKFKFLRDAEEKLIHRRKTMEEKAHHLICSTSQENDEMGSFVTINIDDKERRGRRR